MAGAEQVDRRAPGAPVFHDEALMPFTMGSPYRVADYAYPAWGLGEYKDERLADAAYQAEWAAGNAEQSGLVERAVNEAGLGEFPELLRQNAAPVVGGPLTGRVGG